MRVPPIFSQVVSVAITAVVFTAATNLTKRAIDKIDELTGVKPKPTSPEPAPPAKDDLLS